MKQHELQSYASTFCTFLLRELAEKIERVNTVILYGSVAKGEATIESDVDIFIDTRAKIEPIVTSSPP